eukprot:GDKK01034404.1.p1 GENE.GDKK01034404.1~~GDKK01034404.1.p1  ORF type:complete len:107 (+),score=23.34 GDKK01034404.1:35-322(+)
MAEMGSRFDAMATKQQEQSEALDKALKQRSEVIENKFDVVAAKQQALFSTITTVAKSQSDASAKLEVMLLGNSDKLQKVSDEVKLMNWAGMQPTP